MNNNNLSLSSFLLFLVFLLPTKFLTAQYVVGLYGGSSHYSGDLANSAFSGQDLNFGGGIYGGYYLDNNFQVRGRLTWQKIAADDANNKTSTERNLSFESEIIELAALFSYEYDGFAGSDYRFKPFVYTGIGVYKHNPKAEVNGQLVELQPLGTEGQGIPGYIAPYSLTNFMIPFGGGAKYKVTDNILIELNLDAKKVFTDYLDDVGGKEYVPESILIQNGQTAVDAAYKADEAGGRPFSDFESAEVRELVLRSSGEQDDWYYLFGFSGSYYIDLSKKGRIQKNRKRVPYKYSRY